MPQIHPTAIVSKKAKIGQNVEIGAYSIVEDNVEIGDGTKISYHVVIKGFTVIGKNCRIFSGACIGGEPQDKKFKLGTRSWVKIGNENVFREYVTIHPGAEEDSETIVGDRNLLMVGVHVGHNSIVGNENVLANNVALGGHTVVEDQAVIGGMAGIHQFVRVGRLSMVGALTKLVMDAAPYSICNGNPAAFETHNLVGLKRAGYNLQDSTTIKKILRTILASGLHTSNACEKVLAENPGFEPAEHIVKFIKGSVKGITRAMV